MKIIVFFIVWLLVWNCRTKPDTSSSELFSLELPTTNGDSFDLATEKGTVVVLDFWATWCEPCSKAVPVLNKLRNSEKGKSMHFWGINTDNPANLEEILEKEKSWGMEYPSLLDSDWKIVNKFHINGQPAMMVFNANGKEIYRQYGIMGSDLPGLLLRADEWLHDSKK